MRWLAQSSRILCVRRLTRTALTKMCWKVSWKSNESAPTEWTILVFVNFSHHQATRPTKAIQIIKYSINLRLKETFSENSICIISSPSTEWEFQSISDESWLSEFLIRTSGADSGSGKKLCFAELRRNEDYRNLTVPKHFLSLFILNFTAISEWSEFRTRLELRVAFSSDQVSVAGTMRQFLTERSYSIDFSVLVAMLHEHEKLILVCTLSQAGFNWCLHNKSRSGCKMALKLAARNVQTPRSVGRGWFWICRPITYFSILIDWCLCLQMDVQANRIKRNFLLKF